MNDHLQYVFVFVSSVHFSMFSIFFVLVAMVWRASENSYGFRIVSHPSKHAGSDPEAFLLRPVMAITASVQPESG